jgi:hypothetical protein
MLLAAAVEAEFHAEGDVAEAVLGARVGVGDEGRRAEAQLDAAEGNDLQALGVAIVPGLLACGDRLADEVGAEALLDARGDRDKRRGPVGLLGLGRSEARLIAGEPVGLRGCG